MKGMDLFCSSPASTAVTSSMDHSSMLRRSRSTKSYDQERRKSQFHVPCSSQLPINPKPYFEKHRKSSADKQHSDSTRRKSSVEVSDLYVGSSRRYLLSDAPFIDWVSESNKIPVMAPSQLDAKPNPMVVVNRNDSPSPTLKSSSAHSKDQVVVLRVSLHCKACEGKVRKHISKMEGVTSFSIDMETKKVTIIGDVTPLGVLASVSKVKSAQLWPFPQTSSSVLSSASTPTSLWLTKSVIN